MFDEVVVRALGVSQWVEAQGVDHRQLQDLQITIVVLQMGEIMLDDIVAEQELSTLGDAVQ